MSTDELEVAAGNADDDIYGKDFKLTSSPRNTKGGSITVPLTSCLSGLESASCMTTDIFCFYLQNRLSQSSQTGGQRYSDTSPFSIPWSVCGERLETMLTGTKFTFLVELL
jgi:hypothetical protein